MCDVENKIIENVRDRFSKEINYLFKTKKKTGPEADALQEMLASLPDASMLRLYHSFNSVAIRD